MVEQLTLNQLVEGSSPSRLTTPLIRALHEAGHAVARWCFGTPLRVVSIRPGAGHNGVTISGPGDVDLPALACSELVHQQPAEIRVYVERQIIATLAGWEAGV
jgi:hypothetical protein